MSTVLGASVWFASAMGAMVRILANGSWAECLSATKAGAAVGAALGFLLWLGLVK